MISASGHEREDTFDNGTEGTVVACDWCSLLPVCGDVLPGGDSQLPIG